MFRFLFILVFILTNINADDVCEQFDPTLKVDGSFETFEVLSESECQGDCPPPSDYDFTFNSYTDYLNKIKIDYTHLGQSSETSVKEVRYIGQVCKCKSGVYSPKQGTCVPVDDYDPCPPLPSDSPDRTSCNLASSGVLQQDSSEQCLNNRPNDSYDLFYAETTNSSQDDSDWYCCYYCPPQDSDGDNNDTNPDGDNNDTNPDGGSGDTGGDNGSGSGSSEGNSSNSGGVEGATYCPTTYNSLPLYRDLDLHPSDCSEPFVSASFNIKDVEGNSKEIHCCYGYGTLEDNSTENILKGMLDSNYIKEYRDKIADFVSNFADNVIDLHTLHINIGEGSTCTNPSYNFSVLGTSFVGDVDICSTVDNILPTIRKLLIFLAYILGIYYVVRS